MLRSRLSQFLIVCFSVDVAKQTRRQTQTTLAREAREQSPKKQQNTKQPQQPTPKVMPPRRRRPPAGIYADSPDSNARPFDDESSSSSDSNVLGRPRRQHQPPPEERAAQRQRPHHAEAAIPAAAAAAAAAQRPQGHVAATAHEIDPLRQILSRQGNLYLDDFELDELSRLAYILVKREGYDLDPDPRPPEVQSEIDQHYQRNGADAGLSIHELNEYATTMDYIIKIKANIFGIRRLIRDNDARINITTMRDDDSGDEVLDVWAFLPPTLPYQVCQGTAMQHFGKYLCFFV